METKKKKDLETKKANERNVTLSYTFVYIGIKLLSRLSRTVFDKVYRGN